MSAAPDWLAGEVVTLAWCWLVERRDGAALGFTTHDRAIARGGLVYRSAPGMKPSAVRLSASLDAATMDVAGALTDAAIAAADLDAGRWDGARVTLAAVDWDDEAAPPVVVAAGTLGAVTREGSGFSAELRGFEARLEAPAVPFTAPGCRAALGDSACRVDMAGRRVRASVVAIDGALLTLAAPVAAGLYAHGRLRWLDGPLTGTGAAIVADDGGRIELAEPLRAMPPLPVAVELSEGCDRTLATCSGRFANAANFRGEPHLPGTDLLTRYPGG